MTLTRGDLPMTPNTPLLATLASFNRACPWSNCPTPQEKVAGESEFRLYRLMVR
jgi:hypothetical protein